MSTQSEELKHRTMSFAVLILGLMDMVQQTPSANVIARQLAKSATSIGANYRGCCNARSRSEFIAKLGIVVEESEESVYWLDLVLAARIPRPTKYARPALRPSSSEPSSRDPSAQPVRMPKSSRPQFRYLRSPDQNDQIQMTR